MYIEINYFFLFKKCQLTYYSVYFIQSTVEFLPWNVPIGFCPWLTLLSLLIQLYNSTVCELKNMNTEIDDNSK